MALIAKSQFVGLDDVAHLCTGGEAPWLRSHDAACRRCGALKSAVRGSEGRIRVSGRVHNDREDVERFLEAVDEVD
jgi:selenocysteine lyase/cysteine desulfurase